MYNIKGKTAIVTGSASGLGAAIVEKLADEGVNVIVSSSHKHDDTDEVLDKLRNKGVKAIYIPCDVSDEKQIENLFNESFIVKLVFISLKNLLISVISSSI